MTADAASPDTPTDPREALTLRALNVAGAAAEQAGLRGEFLVLAVAIPALIDAGLLSLSGDSTQTTDEVDPDVLAVLEYVSRGRRYVGVEPYPDFEARRALGRLHDEGSLRSRASGTPSITPEQATALYLAVSARDFQRSFDDQHITTADIADVFREHGIDVVPGPSPHDMGRGTV